MPYLTLVLCAKNKIFGLHRFDTSDEDERCIKEILLIEEELFKEDDAAMRWPVIQLYRNLLVAVLTTFILNSIYRSVILIPLFLIFTVHDALRKPFHNIYLNYLQIMTSACLLTINACNILPSFSIIFDLSVLSAMGDIQRAQKYLELVILAIVPLTFPTWLLWERIQERKVKKQK